MAHKPHVTPARRARRSLIVPIKGMHCASCVSKVEAAVAAVPGAEDVSVSLAAGTVSVTPGPAGLKLDAVAAAVRRAGYEVASVGAEGAEAAARSAQEAEQGELLRRMIGSAVLSIPLMASVDVSLSSYTELALGAAVQLWGGWHFHKGLYLSLKRRAADMNTLVSLSTWAAFLFSAAVVLWPWALPEAARHPQWDAVSGLVVFVTLGRWLEGRTRARAGEAVMRLMRLSPKTARVLREGREIVVPLEEVSVGEIVRVMPGEQVALDGVVVCGASTLDESLLTGESLPVEKAEESVVWGGTMNKTGALDVRVSRPGSESALARIVEAVRHAQASKPRLQRFADKAAAAFVPVAVIAAVSAALVWAFYGPEPQALFSLTVLVSVFAVACPCALGLATPLAVMAGVGRAAEMGIFVRNADVFEAAADLDVVIFDKTGTLTEGRPRVTEVVARPRDLGRLLSLARAAEERSEHPFAAAVVERAKEEGAAAAPVEAFEAFPGRGVAVRSEGCLVRVGSFAWLRESGVSVPAEEAAKFQSRPVSVLGVSVDEDFLGAVVLEDSLRPGAAAAVARLKAMGLEVVLVSGDRNAASYHAAEAAGIGKVYAEILPEEKARIVERFKGEGKRVAMVGEGFNDAPALSGAHVGIALASGTDVAVSAADIVLMSSDLGVVSEAIALCRRVRRVVRQNFAWAFAYNALLIPVAGGALYPLFGALLKPQYAAAAMALSSVSVALNSLRLRRRGSGEPTL